jgi:hypothetical protein
MILVIRKRPDTDSPEARIEAEQGRQDDGDHSKNAGYPILP